MEVENGTKFDSEIKTFQASLETLFFTIGDPKSVKTRFQNYPKMKPFLESDKTIESCSRPHADQAFEV